MPNWQQDSFGNYLARIVCNEKTTKFEAVMQNVFTNHLNN